MQNEKLIHHLGNAQLEISRALYYDRAELSVDDEFMLRECQRMIPGIIERVEEKCLIKN